MLAHHREITNVRCKPQSLMGAASLSGPLAQHLVDVGCLVPRPLCNGVICRHGCHKKIPSGVAAVVCYGLGKLLRLGDLCIEIQREPTSNRAAPMLAHGWQQALLGSQICKPYRIKTRTTSSPTTAAPQWASSLTSLMFDLAEPFDDAGRPPRIIPEAVGFLSCSGCS